METLQIDKKTIINVIKNIILILLIFVVLKLLSMNSGLNKQNKKYLNIYKQKSEKTIKEKDSEIVLLKERIDQQQDAIKESINMINDIQNRKQSVKKIYIKESIRINTFDAEQLKKYFNEELN